MTLWKFIKFNLLLIFLCWFSFQIKAEEDTDTTYVKDYSHWLTTRLYSVTKFNRLTIGDSDESINYFPNNNINIGLGYTYRGFGVNLGFKAPFINNDDDRRGETDFFDAQADYFEDNAAVTFAFQFFRGYYISNPDQYYPKYWDGNQNFPNRRDLRTLNVTLAYSYVFNSDRFSYRSIFVQDQWQRKSAGSFLAGFYSTYLWLSADSGLAGAYNNLKLPIDLNVEYASTFSIGPQGGYAYTFVMWDHFFVSLSLVIGAGYNYGARRYVEENNQRKWYHEHSIGVNAQHRVGIGYNSEKYFIGANYSIGDYLSVFSNNFILFDAGNIRFNIVRRFNHQPKFLDKATDFIRNDLLGWKDNIIGN